MEPQQGYNTQVRLMLAFLSLAQMSAYMYNDLRNLRTGKSANNADFLCLQKFHALGYRQQPCHPPNQLPSSYTFSHSLLFRRSYLQLSLLLNSNGAASLRARPNWVLGRGPSEFSGIHTRSVAQASINTVIGHPCSKHGNLAFNSLIRSS